MVASEVIEHWIVEELDRLRKEVEEKRNYMSPELGRATTLAQREIGARMVLAEIRDRLRPSDSAAPLAIADEVVESIRKEFVDAE